MFTPYDVAEKQRALLICIARLSVMAGTGANETVTVLRRHVMAKYCIWSEIVHEITGIERERLVNQAIASFVMCALDLRGGGHA